MISIDLFIPIIYIIRTYTILLLLRPNICRIFRLDFSERFTSDLNILRENKI